MTVQEFYRVFLEHPVICTDSRKIKPGVLFFALKGEQFDGNRFALEAIEQGAAYAIADDPKLDSHDKLLQVPDVLTFLQELAKYHRSQFEIPVLALTGSNGKTTSKELIAAVLKTKYNLLYTEGNLNNHIGVPLTLLRLNNDHEMALIEMGANHVGEIKQLCEMADPNHGLITNIGKAHLEGFGSYEGVIKAKTELFAYLKSNQGVVFVNDSDPLLLEQLGDYPAIRYGKQSLSVKLKEGFYLDFDFVVPDSKRSYNLQTKLVGHYNLTNALAALSVGQYFNVDWSAGVEAIRSYQPGNNRSQWKVSDRNRLVLDAYNANLSSMELALKEFFELNERNKLLILGEMKELGEYSRSSHERILEMVEDSGIEALIVGAEFVSVAADFGFKAYPGVQDLIGQFKIQAPVDRTILLKGSRGNQLEKLLPYL